MRRLLLCGSLCMVGACASSPEGSAQQIAGCYYFEQDSSARQLNLPWGVQLTADSLDSPFLRRQENVRSAFTLLRPGETRNYPFGYWQVLADDQIRLGYPGMGGFTADLTVQENELTGILGGVGDAAPSPEMQSARVRLTRATCPDQ